MKLNMAEFDAQLPTSRCGVARADMTVDQRRYFNAAMLDTRYSSNLIARVVRAWGYDLSQRVVWRHRTARCSCAALGRPT